MRGRVISFFAKWALTFGMMPLGSLLIGTVSLRIGAQDTILAEGYSRLWSHLLRHYSRPSLRKERMQRKERKREETGRSEEDEAMEALL